jgi:uncharacterized membrane protein (UPF0127 family)
MSQYTSNSSFMLFENFCRKNQVDGKNITAEICGIPLDLKVATTPRSQAKGFMGAKKAPKEGEGILFVYDAEQPLSFWMKDVSFALDIIFFDANAKYVGHETMRAYQGEEDSHVPRYSSKKPARFAVEVAAGWCDKNLKDDAVLSF